MSFQSACESWQAYEAEKVFNATWGHLAPVKNKTYKGYIVWALGCLGSDNLNPTVLDFNLGDLDSSPWLFEAIQRQFGSLSKEGGKVFRWEGTFRNYKWSGKHYEIKAPGLPGYVAPKTVRPTSTRLTKKDFIRLAADIRQLKTKKARQEKVMAIMPELRESNPLFQETRFLAACGLK